MACISRNFDVYTKLPKYPVYLIPGLCPDPIDDLAKVKIPASNSATPDVPNKANKGVIVPVNRSEIICAVRMYRFITSRIRPGTVLKMNLTGCPS
jgi:hypothetical protein